MTSSEVIVSKRCHRLGQPSSTHVGGSSMAVQRMEVNYVSHNTSGSVWSICGFQLIWAATWQNQQNECAPSKDSDQPGRLPSLISVFDVCSLCSQVPKLSSCRQQRCWSDSADAQADLRLHWVHSHFVAFVMSLLNYIWTMPCEKLSLDDSNQLRLNLSTQPLKSGKKWFWILLSSE